MDEKTFAAQGAEFTAMAALSTAYRGLPAIVDDSYPEARHRYEGALHSFLRAVRANRPEQFAPEPISALHFSGALIAELHLEVDAELTRAGKWPAMNSAHEGYGVLMEEVDELWDHVKTRQKNRDLAAMQAEAIQVAAMALRFAHDICNEERGRR